MMITIITLIIIILIILIIMLVCSMSVRRTWRSVCVSSA